MKKSIFILEEPQNEHSGAHFKLLPILFGIPQSGILFGSVKKYNLIKNDKEE